MAARVLSLYRYHRRLSQSEQPLQYPGGEIRSLRVGCESKRQQRQPNIRRPLGSQGSEAEVKRCQHEYAPMRSLTILAACKVKQNAAGRTHSHAQGASFPTASFRKTEKIKPA